MVGLGAAVATASSVQTWYPQLTKPWFTPPDWLFGPAWVTLYALMGVASYLVWLRVDEGEDGEAAGALWWYVAQLGVNAAWSPAFFGAQSPFLGLAVIVPLFGLIVVTMQAFWRISRWAGMLMVPYLAWVGYATALNAAVYLMN